MHHLTLTPPAQKHQTDIFIGAKACSKLPDIIEKLNADAVVVLCDASIMAIAKSLPVKQAKILDVPSGDSSKSLREIERLSKQLLKLNASRQTVLINVGGGMLTDLGGFLGSIFMRGMRFIHVPTTLLGMVDAAIGGKTGVNLGTTKNILGTTTHPAAVICDADFLQKLPDVQMREGLVEVVKIAAMLDADFFRWLEANIGNVLQRKPKALSECVLRAISLKVKTVEEDERDWSVRLHLNFGHTVGHAVEAFSKFSLSHGQAVSIGMIAEMTMAKSSELNRVSSLLEVLKMPTEIPEKFSQVKLWDIMRSDKKNVAGAVRIAVPQGLGRAHVRSVSRKDFAELFS